MANKNDLRFIKTERLIEETYMELRGSSAKSVKISELCQKALINKSTFYTHYDTIEELHAHVCQKHVDNIISQCPPPEDAFSDIPAFVHSILKAIMENAGTLAILFGDDTNMCTNDFETGLIKRYIKGDASSHLTKEMEMKISFAIGGASRLLFSDQSPERIELTIELIQKVIPSPSELKRIYSMNK